MKTVTKLEEAFFISLLYDSVILRNVSVEELEDKRNPYVMTKISVSFILTCLHGCICIQLSFQSVNFASVQLRNFSLCIFRKLTTNVFELVALLL